MPGGTLALRLAAVCGACLVLAACGPKPAATPVTAAPAAQPEPPKPPLVYVMNLETEATNTGGAEGLVKAIEALAAVECRIEHYKLATPERLAELSPALLVAGPQGTPWWEYSETDLAPAKAALKSAACPVLGVCGGHQFLTMAHGAKVAPLKEPPGSKGPGYQGYSREDGWITLTLPGKDPLFEGFDQPPTVLATHCEEVKALPPGFELVARGAVSPIHAMRQTGRPVYGVQFHPEADWEHHPDGKRILTNFLKLAGLL